MTRRGFINSYRASVGFEETNGNRPNTEKAHLRLRGFSGIDGYECRRADCPHAQEIAPCHWPSDFRTLWVANSFELGLRFGNILSGSQQTLLDFASDNSPTRQLRRRAGVQHKATALEAVVYETYRPQEVPYRRPTLPELDQTKKSVLNSLASLQSRRSYQHAMDEFIEW